MKLISSGSTYVYLARCLEGFLYGFYSGIFAMYLQYHESKKGTDNTKNITFYALCVLYFLSTAIVVIDTANFVIDPNATDGSILYPLVIVRVTLFGSCDFIAQCILIYRCWIAWILQDQNICVIIMIRVIPSIIAIAFLATWIAAITAVSIEQGHIVTTDWGTMLNITSLILSMTVNALVTGLIVFRIFKVFQEVKATSDGGLNVTGRTKLRSAIFIIIESGMALFSIQLARLIVTIVFGAIDDSGAYYALQIIVSIHQMLNGITPTIILVRVSMGWSFHDETSMVEVAESFVRFAPEDSFTPNGSLRVALDHPNPVPGMENVSQERREDDIGGSDDIQMVDR